MPVATVRMQTGQTSEPKRSLAKAITETMVKHTGANPTHLHLVIQEVPKENWPLPEVMGDKRKD
jgi:4-oxalocrotonate tautomerase family enzyme